MIPRCGGQNRFLFLLASVLFFSASSSFADQELSPFASASSTIISIGIAGFSLLALYVVFLTVTFLAKVFKEASQARKDAAHGAPEHPKDFGQSLLTAAGWFLGFLTLVALGTLMAGSMGIAAGAAFFFCQSPLAFII